MLTFIVSLAVQLHHYLALKFLTDSLNKLGFRSSYSEVRKFDICKAASQGQSIPGLTLDNFVQYVADNVEHNVRTLNRLNTFDGRGIDTEVTPGVNRTGQVPRDNTHSEAAIAKPKINIYFYRPSEQLSNMLVIENQKVIE